MCYGGVVGLQQDYLWIDFFDVYVVSCSLEDDIYMTDKLIVTELQKTFGISSVYANKLFLQLVDKSDYLVEIEKLIEGRPKPFVKWVGGKRQLLAQFRFLDLYPPTAFDPINSRYFEPFVGGGAVFFDLLPDCAYLSDLNLELIKTYNVIKTDVENLIISLKKHASEKDYFLRMRSINPDNLSDLEIASRFIYLNRTCFNGMYRVNKRGQFNVPFGKYSNPLICDEVNLRRVSGALEKVQISHEDYKEVLKKAEKGDLIYFDPPYYPVSKTASFTSYTSEAFLEKEQNELKETFLTLHRRGCYVMLSNSDTPFINDLYSGIDGIRISRVQAGRAINSDATKRGKVTEVVVTNY